MAFFKIPSGGGPSPAQSLSLAQGRSQSVSKYQRHSPARQPHRENGGSTTDVYVRFSQNCPSAISMASAAQVEDEQPEIRQSWS